MKKIVSLLMCLCLILSTFTFVGVSVSAEETEYTDGYYTYTVSNGKATITDCDTSISGDITIPSTLGGYPVTSIGYYAFRDCTSLTSIIIPDSVTSIGQGAFYSCTSLTSITVDENNQKYCSVNGMLFNKNKTTIICYPAGKIATSYTVPDSVTSISSSAFSGCTSLTSITIPDSVTSIGFYAFEKCTSLTSISVDENNSDFCSADGVLFNKNKTTLVCYPAGKIETSYAIPNSVTFIQDCAFLDCSSLTNITIGDNVIRIGVRAFYNTGYYNNNDNWEDDALYIDDCLINVKTSLSGKYKIKEGSKLIAEYAFSGCKLLTSITIPDSVINIGQGAFINCNSLTNINIPKGVTSIGYQAFYNCTSLTSITIPDSVTSVGFQAFENCEIKELIIAEGSKTITSTIVVCESTLEKVTIPNSVTNIGKSAFYNCTSLTSITIPDGVTSIGDYTFYQCTSLTSITIPDSVINIGQGAFINCNSLTNINIPKGVTSIGYQAFYNCTSLTSIIIPNSVTCIDHRVFDNCTSLTSITIPDSVTSIADWAFRDCRSLTSITIPDSVTSIGYGAFRDCRSLTNITIGEGVTSIGGGTFINTEYYNNSSNWEDDALYIGDCLIDVKTSLTGEYEIKEGTKVIGNEAFYDCASLTSIIIPNSVTSIGDYAFYNCTSLTSITIGDSVTSIGNRAFDGCNATFYCNCTNSYIADYLENISKTYALIHDYTILIYNDDQHWYKCSRCDETSGNESHSFENYKSNNDATCTENGTETGKCKVCGTTNTRQIANSELGHEYSSEWSVDKQATCSETGIMSKHCVRYEECGSKTEEITTPKTKHTESDWEIVVEATENNDGLRRKICTVCKETLETEYFEYHKHSYEFEITKEATCEESGIKTYTCTLCPDSYTEEIGALGHNHGEWVVDKQPTCTALGHKYQICTECEEILANADIPMTEHDYNTKVVDPTCTEQGYTLYICNDCGATKKGNYTFEQGHSAVIDSAIAPTCTEIGLTQGAHCSVCGEVLVAQQIVNAKGHAPKWVISKSATHFVAGEQVNKCSTCGEILSKKAIAKKTYTAPGITGSKKKITVKYKAVSGATGFEVRYKIKGKWKTVKYTTKKAKTVAIKSLKKGKYQVQVRAVKGALKTNWSKVKKITVK